MLCESTALLLSYAHKLVHRVGFSPTTYALKARYSDVELPMHKSYGATIQTCAGLSTLPRSRIAIYSLAAKLYRGQPDSARASVSPSSGNFVTVSTFTTQMWHNDCLLSSQLIYGDFTPFLTLWNLLATVAGLWNPVLRVVLWHQ